MVPLKWCVSVTVSFVLGALFTQLTANGFLPPSNCPPCASRVSSVERSGALPAEAVVTTSFAVDLPYQPSTTPTLKLSKRGPTTTPPFKSVGDVGRKNGEAAYRWVKLPGVADKQGFLGKVQSFLSKRPEFIDNCPMAVKTVKRAVRNVRSMHDELDGVLWGDQHPHFKAFLLVAHAVAEYIPSEGLLLEFGVASGSSIVLTAGILKAKLDKRRVYGFDTFTGLPENWGAVKKGAYAYRADGTLPPVPSRVSLIKGLFSDTLPAFLEQHPEPAAFINIDCDLYKGAVYVLKQLAPRMRPGTIIHFHELNQNGFADELKALYDFLSSNDGFKMEILDVVAHAEAALVRVVSVPEQSN